jgi:murein DD-endopeptidase MepM/ murein hydrolase activator NlpD
MLCFPLASGRSAVRLARLLREQEVAGSNPVAPTNYNMSKKESYPLRFIFISVALLSLAACSPSPKYRGGAAPGEDRKYRTRKPAVPAPTAPTLFSPPIRNYSTRRLTSRFGIRKDPRYGTREFHHGIDIKARMGEDVLAAAPGTVIFAGRQSGFGNVVIIDHGKRFCTVSAHLSSMLVGEGEVVERGRVIGKVGKSGNATGTHLHFEIRVAGKSVDPLQYLRSSGEP